MPFMCFERGVPDGVSEDQEEYQTVADCSLALGMPALAVLVFGPSVLTLALHHSDYFRFSLLWLIPAGLLWFRYFIITLTGGKRLNWMMQTLGAETDADMDAILCRAEAYEKRYYMTDTHFINFRPLCAYPCSEIRSVKCKEHNSEDGLRYDIRLKYGDGKTDKIELHRGEEYNRLKQMLAAFI